MEVTENFTFEKIFESITEPVSVHDRNFRIIRANEAMCSLLGLQFEKIVGRPCYEVFHDTEHPWPECPHIQCLDSGKASEEIIEDPQFSYPLKISCSPIAGHSGKIEGTVHIVRKLPGVQLNNHHNSIPSSVIGVLKKLEGCLVICASCRKIRHESGEWDFLEHYLAKHTSIVFSHGLCPECYVNFRKELDDFSLETTPKKKIVSAAACGLKK